MIWIITFILGFTILIATFIQNANSRSKYNDELELASNNLNFATKQMEDSSLPIFELILKYYGERFASNVANKRICEEMPSELLILSWGKPGDIKSEYYKGTNSESWFYNGYINRLGNKKYKKEVYVENNKITGWRDLN